MYSDKLETYANEVKFNKTGSLQRSKNQLKIIF